MNIPSIALTVALFVPWIQAQETPRPVEELLVDIRQKLNAGDLLWRSKDDVAALIRHAPGALTLGLPSDLVATLTDDEIAGYISAWVDLALICRADEDSRYSLEEYYADPPKNPPPPPIANSPGCKDWTEVANAPIWTLDDLDEFVGLMEARTPLLKQLAQTLTSPPSPYWEKDVYLANRDTISGWLGNPEIVARMAPHRTQHLYELLDYDDIYIFRIMGFTGYIGASDGQANLLMLMPVKPRQSL